MRALLLTAALLSVSVAHADAPSRWVVSVEGMSCASCNRKTTAALRALPGVAMVHASFLKQGACVEGTSLDEAVAKAAVEGLGYTFGGVEAVTECPEGLRGTLPGPWDERAVGLDVVTVSRGEEVDLDAHLAAGKYTIVDFGAPWCAPCHDAAERIAAYLGEHPDVAVRAVDLAGETVDDSYAQPVVAQHLKYVDGIPWLVVHRPDGKVLTRGRDVEKILTAIDKHRAKQARRTR